MVHLTTFHWSICLWNRDNDDSHQWQSALLVVGLSVTKDWFEMGCPCLISIRLTACRTSIPKKRSGNHKQTTNEH